ncbi:hypothetical protein ACFLYE_01560 [Chloroflexota bacterium]
MPGNLDNHDSPLKAAIIDQLCLLEPNPELIAQTTQILENSGFHVDVWQGEDITVDFLRNLPNYNYKLVIFRAHLGTECLVNVNDPSDVISMQTTGLFTGETYSTNKYFIDQMSDSVYQGVMAGTYPPVFTISPKFVREGSNGKYNDTMIIMMGCISLYHDDLAKSFIDKGASAYVGWSATVTLNQVDKIIPVLTSRLCVEKLPISLAILQTMNELGRDPYFNAGLRYFPAEVGKETIIELIR